MTKRATYRVNADSWTKLQQILVGTPEEFNGEYSVDRSGQFPRYKNALRGRKVENGRPFTGQLPEEYRASVYGADYIIYSYETPIAWRNAGRFWIVPDVKYSITTSKHQGKVRTALSQISGGI